MPYDSILLEQFGDDPEALREFERIRALRGDVGKAQRLQRLGAVGALATDEGLRGFGDNLYRTGAVQEDRYNEAMAQGYEGLKQTRSRAKEREEEKAWREQQRKDQLAYQQQTLALQRAQEARMREQMDREGKKRYQHAVDPISGEMRLYDITTGEWVGGPQGGKGGQAASMEAAGIPITGAAGIPGKLTESQATGGRRVGEGTIAMQNALNAGFPDESFIGGTAEQLMGAAARFGAPQLATKKVQQQNAFWSNVADPIVRARTGAAMPVEEFRNQMAMLVPRAGEDPETQMLKAQQLVAFMKSGTVGLPPQVQQALLQQLAQIEAQIPTDQDSWARMRTGIGGVGGVSSGAGPTRVNAAPTRNFESEYGLGGR